ncbi:hypothetical protein ABZ114_11105 [Streptomyces albidoflavus]|uniref:hypothetical protein n=1 Tax=Streptomyces albidoflavus TaxID=1886 RepID=UPI0033A3793C
MSANDRQARGFPAFAARRGGRVRGQSWWGKAWADALEDTFLDEDALKRDRSYARTGQLGPITVSPGELSTTGYQDGSPFRTVLTLHELDDAAWESLWEKTAALPEVADGLLAGELPPDLMEPPRTPGSACCPATATWRRTATATPSSTSARTRPPAALPALLPLPAPPVVGYSYS